MASSPLNNHMVNPKSVIANPDPEDLRKLVAQMPNAQKTEFDNYNVKIKVKARSKSSTYIVTDSPQAHSDQTMSKTASAEIAQMQNDYIAQQDMIVIDGFIGPDPATRTAARLTIEKTNANIAAMQQQLYFTPTAQEFANFEPELNIVYTPNLIAQGFPNDRLITVDLENKVTRVLNSDYFGESKKAGLRMWNHLIYNQGGLSLHAGCKMIPVNGTNKVALIIGLSGTGKTTTTFSKQNDSKPVQDDFVALMPGGKILGTENGCFAKTFGLNAESEPMIYQAVTNPMAYMENVAVDSNGRVDFYNNDYTENGRATFPFQLLSEAGDPRNLSEVDFVLILNRNETIIPAVARLTKEQAAAYFMLGETKGTSAGGAEEAGKALRVPGTNPFFPMLHQEQGNRFLELLNQRPVDVFLMNTGWVGGADGTAHSKKVKIRHSSAVVQGIADNSIQWQKDHAFGYEIASEIPGIATEDHFLLRPAEYYKQTNRESEYATLVEQLKASRQEYLAKYEGLSSPIVTSV